MINVYLIILFIFIDKQSTCLLYLHRPKRKTIKVNGKVYITEGKYRLPACVDERTQVYEHPGMYTIYHLELENEEPTMNYGIYANGLLVESCSIRFMKELSMLTLLE